MPAPTTPRSDPRQRPAGARKQGPRRTPQLPRRREFSAGFILYRESRGEPLFLLLDYGRHWDYPKGHIEKGENPWQAAVRELREETGIRQVDRITRFQRDMHYRFVSSKKGPIDKTVTYFLGRTRAVKVALSDEHTGHAWLPFPRAMERLTFPNARTVLSAAHLALLRETGAAGAERKPPRPES